MHKKRLIFRLVLVAVFSLMIIMLFICVLTIKAPKTTSDNGRQKDIVSTPHVVSKELAKQAAQCELAKRKANVQSWDAANLGDDELLFYDYRGQPSAYVFPVQVSGTYAGYITISATSDFFPLLEAASSPAVYPPSNFNSVREICVKQLGVDINNLNTDLVYIMGQDYILRVSSSDTNCFINLVTKRLYTENDLANVQEMREIKGVEIGDKAIHYWKLHVGSTQCNL